jgi:hypothetical protein
MNVVCISIIVLSKNSCQRKMGRQINHYWSHDLLIKISREVSPNIQFLVGVMFAIYQFLRSYSHINFFVEPAMWRNGLTIAHSVAPQKRTMR